MSLSAPKFLLLKSTQRSSTSSSATDCELRLAEALHNVSAVNLRRFSCPNTIYNIQTGINDVVCLTRSSTDYTVTIDAGSYTANALATAIQAEMNDADSNSYTCTYDSKTMKFTITGSAAFTLTWATHTSASTGMYKVLGWTAADTSSATSQTATVVANLSSPTSMLMRITEFGSCGVCGNLPYTFDLPLNVASGMLTYIASSTNYPQRLSFGQAGRSFQNLHVRLFDDENTEIELNGAEWELLLEIEYLPLDRKLTL